MERKKKQMMEQRKKEKVKYKLLKEGRINQGTLT